MGGILINPAFQSHFGIDPKDKIQEADVNGTIVSVLQVGCLFGALLATSTAGIQKYVDFDIDFIDKDLNTLYIYIDSLGRKYSIIASSIIFIIGGILQVIGNGLSMLYIGRVIGGLGKF